jgi:hypothetical protein
VRARRRSSASRAGRRPARRPGRSGRAPAHRASWPPAEWPPRRRATGPARVAELGEVVDARGDVVERHGPAAPAARGLRPAAGTRGSTRPAPAREVGGERPRDELAVAGLPVAAVQDDRDGNGPSPARRCRSARPGEGSPRSGGGRAREGDQGDPADDGHPGSMPGPGRPARVGNSSHAAARRPGLWTRSSRRLERRAAWRAAPRGRRLHHTSTRRAWRTAARCSSRREGTRGRGLAAAERPRPTPWAAGAVPPARPGLGGRGGHGARLEDLSAATLAAPWPPGAGRLVLAALWRCTPVTPPGRAPRARETRTHGGWQASPAIRGAARLGCARRAGSAGAARLVRRSRSAPRRRTASSTSPCAATTLPARRPSAS